MTATLFIGPQDEIFDWKDQIPLLLGVLGGMAGTTIILLLLVWLHIRSEKKPYAAVAMIELKSKAIDQSLLARAVPNPLLTTLLRKHISIMSVVVKIWHGYSKML